MEAWEIGALMKFSEDLAKCKLPHHHLLTLEYNGWREECPREDYWVFSHTDFYCVLVKWAPGKAPWI